jgi:hypothetical protein
VSVAAAILSSPTLTDTMVTPPTYQQEKTSPKWLSLFPDALKWSISGIFKLAISGILDLLNSHSLFPRRGTEKPCSFWPDD